MTTTQHDLDRWFAALDLDPNTASRLYRDTAAIDSEPETDSCGTRFGLSQLADGFDLQWAELENRHAHSTAQKGSRRRLAVVAAGGCVATVSIAIALSLPQTSSHPASPNAAHPAHPIIPAAGATAAPHPGSPAAGDCPTVPVVTGTTVKGSGTGGTDSGPNAVMAFENAYYRTRSGAAAREVTTPDAQVPPAEVIQSGIDSIPSGTGFCVAVSPSGPDAWQVDLTETRPTRPPTLYQQTVTTTSVDGRVLITGITQR